jgi:hypothetical protein
MPIQDNNRTGCNQSTMTVRNKTTIIAAYNYRLPDRDQQLAWIIGEWYSHNSSSQNINWDEVLDLVEFDVQKRIVQARRHCDFERNWLHYLVVASRRRTFRELREEAEEYCRRKFQSRRKTAQNQAMVGEKRWSAASPAAFQYLFPHIRVKKLCSLPRKRHVNDVATTSDDAVTMRPRNPIDDHVNIVEEAQQQRIIPSNPNSRDGTDASVDRNDHIPTFQHDQTDNALVVSKLQVAPHATKRGDRPESLSWDLIKLDAIAAAPQGMSDGFKELAFLLEQACHLNLSCHWDHVLRTMSPPLRAFVESKSHLVSFHQHGNKYRCLVGERSSPRRIQMDAYRKKLRTTISASLPVNTSNRESIGDASTVAKLRSRGGQGDEASFPGKTAHEPGSSPSPVERRVEGQMETEMHMNQGMEATTKDGNRPAKKDCVERSELQKASVKRVEKVFQGPAEQEGQFSKAQHVKSLGKASTRDENEVATLTQKRQLNATLDVAMNAGDAEISTATRQVDKSKHSRKDDTETPKHKKSRYGVPTRVVTIDESLLDEGSDLTTHDLEEVATRRVDNSPANIVTIPDALHPTESYVSTLRSYQLFSSSMRREAHLLLHISQWKTWHLTNHSSGSVFAKTQEVIFNAFRDDEVQLSKQAFSNAKNHIVSENEEIIEMAGKYALLREKTWVWWCALTYGYCVEFAAQSPRMWDDFEYTQRSLWEYAMQLETAMRDFHFNQCLQGPRNPRDAVITSTLLEQEPASAIFLGEAGHYVHHYIDCLRNYLNLSASVRKSAFIRSYLEQWKAWLPTRYSRVSFLEAAKTHLTRFQVEERSLVEVNFRGPYLRGFDGACGRPMFAREIELYLTLRDKLWHFFCHEIVWKSWKECFSKEDLTSEEFEKSQMALWDYFEKMEHVILKVHGSHCSQLARTTWVSPAMSSSAMGFP